MSRSRIRTATRALDRLKRYLAGSPAPLVVVATVPENATPDVVAGILDEAQAQAEAADLHDGPRPVLRVALQTPEGWEPDLLPHHEEPDDPAERR